MAEDTPEVGLVIRHLYLWRNEKIKGQEEGRKARPCLIVHTRKNEHDETEVYICPITHTPPHKDIPAIEIPHVTKQRLELDSDKSWLITGEVNRFTWRGPDVVNTQCGEFAYGYMPRALTQDAVNQVKTLAKERSLAITNRDDEVLKERVREIRNKMSSDQGKEKEKDRDR